MNLRVLGILHLFLPITLASADYLNGLLNCRPPVSEGSVIEFPEHTGLMGCFLGTYVIVPLPEGDLEVYIATQETICPSTRMQSSPLLTKPQRGGEKARKGKQESVPRTHSLRTKGANIIGTSICDYNGWRSGNY